jgi:hypothetical protein
MNWTNISWQATWLAQYNYKKQATTRLRGHKLRTLHLHGAHLLQDAMINRKLEMA